MKLDSWIVKERVLIGLNLFQLVFYCKRFGIFYFKLAFVGAKKKPLKGAGSLCSNSLECFYCSKIIFIASSKAAFSTRLICSSVRPSFVNVSSRRFNLVIETRLFSGLPCPD